VPACEAPPTPEAGGLDEGGPKPDGWGDVFGSGGGPRGFLDGRATRVCWRATKKEKGATWYAQLVEALGGAEFTKNQGA